tara:strand:- start:891 stop:1283 length:393 start_codon:yes stop_codon:yes gene_type:complete
MNKPCSKCKKMKDFDEFYKGQDKHGRRSRCKDCSKEDLNVDNNQEGEEFDRPRMVYLVRIYHCIRAAAEATGAHVETIRRACYRHNLRFREEYPRFASTENDSYTQNTSEERAQAMHEQATHKALEMEKT